MAVRFPLARGGRSGCPAAAACPEAWSEDGAEGVAPERCTAIVAGGLVTVDFPALGPSSAALESCGPAEVGAFAFAAVGAFGSALVA